ncbi:MAG: hypothetical protein ACQER4_06735 [Bacteroidota bacterium]
MATDLRYPRQFFPFLLMLVLTLATVTQESAAQIIQPEGQLQPTDKDDFWPHTLSGNVFSELWTYQFYLEDGTKIHAAFSVGNFGSLKSAVSGLRLSVLFPDSETYHLAREYPLDKLVQDRENHQLRFHPERELYINGKLPEEHHVTINTQKDGVVFDLTIDFDNIQPGFKWGDGVYRIGNQDLGIITHIPYAEVHARGEVGEHTFDDTGTAYMDQTFQFQTTTKMLEEGYRFVRHHSPTQWDILYVLRPDNAHGDRALGHYVQQRGDSPELAGIENARVESRGRAFGKSVAHKVTFQRTGGDTLALERLKDEERFSLFAELGWLARRAARTFLGGEVIDIRGVGRMQDPYGSSLEGEYNFFIVD